MLSIEEGVRHPMEMLRVGPLFGQDTGEETMLDIDGIPCH